MVLVFVSAVALLSAAAAAQPPPPAAPATSATFTIFLGTTAVGTETVGVARTPEGWTISSSGRINAPLDIVTRRLELKYDANWKPLELTLDAVVRGQEQMLHTTVRGNTLTHQITAAGQTRDLTTMSDIDVFLPNNVFAPFEAVVALARTAAPGSTIGAMVAPQALGSIRFGPSATDRIATSRQTLDTRRTHLTLISPARGAAPLDADVWADPDGHFLRLSVPAQSLQVLREDLASATTRIVAASRPNDEQVEIPGAGFLLAGTIAKPTSAGTTRLPAVVLVGGSGPTDRDGVAFGVPILGDLANALADAGFLTLRYDKRGVGQSGGRIESTTVDDAADDLRAAVKFLTQRADVDPRRVVAVGYGDGGTIALLAARKDKRIAAVGLLASNGVSGAELVLEQQEHLLERSNFTVEDKQARIDAQRRLEQAVITGKGWDEFSPELRRQLDTAEYQSMLLSDPTKVLPDVRQPILILQGMLDTEVAPTNADRLEELARKRKGAGANPDSVHVVKLPGINHLLVPAGTGEKDEYATLADKHVSPDVATALASWLTKTLK